MKMACVRFSSIFVFALFSLFCASRSLNPEWATTSEVYYGIAVYAEPGLKRSTVIEAAQMAKRIEKHIQSKLFRETDSFEYELVLYKNQDTYRATFEDGLPSLARFHSREKQLHISADIPEHFWRHELTHALLESVAPGSPYWMHEGLADLMMSSYRPDPIRPNCGTIQIAKERVSLLPLLRRSKESPESKIKDRNWNQFIERYGLSSYFVLYLWKSGNLMKDLNLYYDGKGRFRIWKTTGISQTTIQDFREWLKSEEPLQPIYGCFQVSRKH